MDPPWTLSGSNPTRGVKIGYPTLSDNEIKNIKIENLVDDGLIFIWCINSKMMVALKMMMSWGFEYVEEIQWIKQTSTGKIAKGHAHYLQHSKESCLVGIKGNPKLV